MSNSDSNSIGQRPGHAPSDRTSAPQATAKTRRLTSYQVALVGGNAAALDRPRRSATFRLAAERSPDFADEGASMGLILLTNLLTTTLDDA